jgi:hypothetical protein
MSAKRKRTNPKKKSLARVVHVRHEHHHIIKPHELVKLAKQYDAPPVIEKPYGAWFEWLDFSKWEKRRTEVNGYASPELARIALVVDAVRQGWRKPKLWEVWRWLANTPTESAVITGGAENARKELHEPV